MATKLERRAGNVGFEEGIPERRTARGDERTKEKRLAQGLGWFSIGLGVAQIGAPRAVARLIGVGDDDETRNTMLAIGLREITSGIGILNRSNPAPWLWSRVGGDVMDLALLGKELSSSEADRPRLAAATAAVVGVTLLDLFASQQYRRRPNGSAVQTSEKREVQVREAITVKCSVEQAYRFWRDFQNLPRFMSHLASVRATGSNRLHWTAQVPGGLKFEWEAEIIDDRPDERIAWRSLPGGNVESTGAVEFRRAPGDRGTEVVMDLSYRPPGGRVVEKIAKLLGKTLEVQVARDLRAFKQIVEIGEVMQSDASIHRGPHPAQPSDREPAARESLEERGVQL